MAGPNFSNQDISQSVGESDIDDNGIDTAGHQRKFVHRFGGGPRRVHREAGALQEFSREHLTKDFILHEQNSAGNTGRVDNASQLPSNQAACVSL